MHEPLEGGKTHQLPAQASAFEPHGAPPQVECGQQQDDPENDNGTDPAQPHFVELAPVAAGGINQYALPLVGDRDPALDRTELLQQALLWYNVSAGIDGVRLLLGQGGNCQAEQEGN